MTYEQVLCPNDTLLLNNSYLLQQFSLHTHEITPFANKKNSMRTMLDQSGSLTLWYTGEEIRGVAGNGKMQEVKRPEFCLLLLRDALSPAEQSGLPRYRG